MAIRPNVWSGEEDVAVGRAADTEARAGRRDVKRMLMRVCSQWIELVPYNPSEVPRSCYIYILHGNRT